VGAGASASAVGSVAPQRASKAGGEGRRGAAWGCRAPRGFAAGFVSAGKASALEGGAGCPSRAVGLGQRVAREVGRAGPAGGKQAPRRARVTMMPVGVPQMPYKTPNEPTWQWVDLWNCLYRERILFIGEPIMDEMANQLIAVMLYLDSVNQNKMMLYINCPGGDTAPAMAIHDTMKACKSKIGTVAFGQAASMAGFLVASGTRGMRFSLPHTKIMLHQPSAATRGQASDIQNEWKELIRIRKLMYESLSKSTGKDTETLKRDLDRDFYLDPIEAINYGLIDEVVRPATKKDFKNI